MGLECLHTPVGCHVCIFVYAQVKLYAVVLRLVFVEVFLLNCGEVLCQGLPQCLLGQQGVVAAYVVVAFEVGSNGKVDCGLVGTDNLQDAVAAAHFSALDFGRGSPGECHFALLAFVPAAYSAKHNLVALGPYGHVLLRRCHLGVACYHAFLVCREVYGKHVVAQRGYVFTLVVHSAGGVACYGARRVEAQFAVVVCVVVYAGKANVQVAERLVGHTAVCFGLYMFRGKCLCLLVFAFPYQLPYFRKVLQGVRVGVVVWASGPYCFLVQLQALGIGLAEHHCADAAVAYRQCLRPCCGRSVVPQVVAVAVQAVIV